MAFILTPASPLAPISHRRPLVTRTATRPLLPRRPRPCRLPSLRMSVTVGSPAVDFSLPTSGGGTLSAADLHAKADFVIIYFYPRDATPGCTTEAKDFRDLAPQLEQLNATVVGVSRDSVESHDAFVKDLDLNFPLITDDGTLTEGYGVWKLRKLGDKEMMIVERSTFVIRGGKVVKEWRGVKSTGHAAAVVESLKSL